MEFVTDELIAEIATELDRYVRIWWWQAGRNLLTFRVPDGQVRDGAFHGRRGLLAVCGGEGIKIWQIWTARRIQKITTANALSLRLISFSPDGKTLIAASFTCTIHCWDVNSGRHLFDLQGHPTQIFEIQYDDSGQVISTCLEQVRVWNITTGICTKTISLARDCGKGFAYLSPLIVTGSDNGVVKVWNLETGKCLQTATGNSPRLMEVAAHPHRRVIASSRDDGTIHLWDLSEPLLRGTLPPERVYQGHRGMATSLALSPNGLLLASTGSDRIINIWDFITGRMLQSLTGHTDYVVQLLFIDDRTLLSRSYDATVRQWDLTTGGSEVINYLERQWCMTLCRSPDGGQILFGSDTPVVTILGRRTNTISSYPAVGNRVRTMIYTGDCRFIVAITDDRHLNLWDTQANYHHCSWIVSDLQISDIELHPIQPHLLLIATEEGNISIWDLNRQTCLSSVIGHYQEIRSLKTISDPDRLISCGIDGLIKVWEFIDDGINEVYSIDFPKPYQDLNLTGVKGLNRCQLTTLQQLGAIHELPLPMVLDASNVLT